MGKIKVLGAVGAAVGGIVVGLVVLLFSFLRKKEPDASKKGSKTSVSSSKILSEDKSPLSDIKTDEESKNGDSVTYSNPVADESGSGDSSEKREKMSILVQGVTNDSQSSESLQEKMKNLMDARARVSCWGYDEFKELLDEAMSVDETLDDGIENLKTCEEFLKGIFCDENGDCKKNLSSSDLKINCKKAEELLISLKKARKSLFRAFIKGYRGGDKETDLYRVVRGISSCTWCLYSSVITIRESDEITVEGTSDSDGANKLQKEINDLLKWLDTNAYRAEHHLDFFKTESDLLSDEAKAYREAYYKVFDNFLEEYFRERESRKKS